MADIITLGELLIDLTQRGTDEHGYGSYVAYPGGAPANVAVAAARLGTTSGFIGKVGNDSFGRGLAETIKREGVDTTGLYLSDEVPTTLAIVSVDETGEREFSFYRNPGADTQLTAEEALEALDSAVSGPPEILHVGSLSLTTSPSNAACRVAVRFARDKGILVSYDPNYRAALWESEEFAIEMMGSMVPLADILKVSEEEMEMLTGTGNVEEGSRILAERGPALVLITLGAKGVFVRFDGHAELIPGFSVKVADTNGAGDTFHGAMLSQLAKWRKKAKEDSANNREWPTWDELHCFVTYANKAASLTCSRSGAIPAMPYASELQQF